MEVSLIAAMTENRAIGGGNALLWRVPEDLKRFKRITLGHTIMMGRRTFESVGRPLAGRRNLVISRHPGTPQSGMEWWTDVDAAMDSARRAGEEELFICGGGEIYRLCMPAATRMYLTIVHVQPRAAADTWFPDFNASDWQITAQQNLADCEFIDYQRLIRAGR